MVAISLGNQDTFVKLRSDTITRLNVKYLDVIIYFII